VSLLALSLLVLGCETLTTVHVRNETPAPIVIVNTGGSPESVTLSVGDEVSTSIFPNSDLSLRVETSDGRTIFHGTISWEDQQRSDFVVTFADGGLAPLK
jgi:hypothetical protein